MNIRIENEDSSSIEAYASVPIAFEVASVFDVEHAASAEQSPIVVERTLDVSYIKDYDSVWGDGPVEWLHRFDVSGWHFLAAYVDGKRVGGAVVIMRAPDVEMLEGRDDLAILWDIRVAPSHRSHGIGSALIDAAEKLAAERGASVIKVETQNINVPACRFYESRGFELKFANARIYPDLPHEVQFLLYKTLDQRAINR